MAIDQCFHGIFSHITEFMRFNINQSQRDLFASYMIRKFTRFAAFGSSRNLRDDDASDEENGEEEDEIQSNIDYVFSEEDKDDSEFNRVIIDLYYNIVIII